MRALWRALQLSRYEKIDNYKSAKHYVTLHDKCVAFVHTHTLKFQSLSLKSEEDRSRFLPDERKWTKVTQLSSHCAERNTRLREITTRLKKTFAKDKVVCATLFPSSNFHYVASLLLGVLTRATQMFSVFQIQGRYLWKRAPQGIFQRKLKEMMSRCDLRTFLIRKKALSLSLEFHKNVFSKNSTCGSNKNWNLPSRIYEQKEYIAFAFCVSMRIFFFFQFRQIRIAIFSETD